jgi:hypothetical protein
MAMKRIIDNLPLLEKESVIWTPDDKTHQQESIGIRQCLGHIDAQPAESPQSVTA